MGCNNSILSKEQVNEYAELTYLTKLEIESLFNKFYALGPELIAQDMHHRFHVNNVLQLFPEIQHNPFRERFFRVFSSRKDLHYSFEDILDLCSIMSDMCPLGVKAAWIFRMFDFDEDNYITAADVGTLVDKLTHYGIETGDKKIIIDALFSEIDIQQSNMLTESDFVHVITKLRFECVYSFKF